MMNSTIMTVFFAIGACVAQDVVIHSYIRRPTQVVAAIPRAALGTMALIHDIGPAAIRHKLLQDPTRGKRRA